MSVRSFSCWVIICDWLRTNERENPEWKSGETCQRQMPPGLTEWFECKRLINCLSNQKILIKLITFDLPFSPSFTHSHKILLNSFFLFSPKKIFNQFVSINMFSQMTKKNEKQNNIYQKKKCLHLPLVQVSFNLLHSALSSKKWFWSQLDYSYLPLFPCFILRKCNEYSQCIQYMSCSHSYFSLLLFLITVFSHCT